MAQDMPRITIESISAIAMFFGFKTTFSNKQDGIH